MLHTICQQDVAADGLAEHVDIGFGLEVEFECQLMESLEGVLLLGSE